MSNTADDDETVFIGFRNKEVIGDLKDSTFLGSQSGWGEPVLGAEWN